MIVRHCRTVATVAGSLPRSSEARGSRSTWRLTVAGALLHDIGRNRVQTVRHGLEGVGDAREARGSTGRCVEIVRRHVGAGISPEEAKTLGLPDLDYIPRTSRKGSSASPTRWWMLDRVRPFEEEVRRFKRKGHDVERLLALKQNLEDRPREGPRSTGLRQD